MRRAIAVPAVVTSLALGACAVSSGVAIGPTYGRDGGLGLESRVDLAAHAGSPELRFGVALDGGAGWRSEGDIGYGLVGTELSVEGGRDLRWRVGAPIDFRIGSDLRIGGGLAGSLLVITSEGAEHGGLAIGPRVALEALDGPDGAEAFVQLDLVLRWVFFDSSGNSWTR